jgi:glutathione S-transferase
VLHYDIKQRQALLEYADSIAEQYPELAADLRAKYTSAAGWRLSLATTTVAGVLAALESQGLSLDAFTAAEASIQSFRLPRGVLQVRYLGGDR